MDADGLARVLGDIAAVRSTAWRATRWRRRRGRTRSSTPCPTPSSTTRRSRSAARARCRRDARRGAAASLDADLLTHRSRGDRAVVAEVAARSARRRRAARSVCTGALARAARDWRGRVRGAARGRRAAVVVDATSRDARGLGRDRAHGRWCARSTRGARFEPTICPRARRSARGLPARRRAAAATARRCAACSQLGPGSDPPSSRARSSSTPARRHRAGPPRGRRPRAAGPLRPRTAARQTSRVVRARPPAAHPPAHARHAARAGPAGRAARAAPLPLALAARRARARGCTASRACAR